MTIEEKIKELKRQYMRRWRRKNPDKMKEYQQRYWQKKAEQMDFHNCPVCGSPITGKAKFCSPACKQAAYRERKRSNRNAP